MEFIHWLLLLLSLLPLLLLLLLLLVVTAGVIAFVVIFHIVLSFTVNTSHREHTITSTCNVHCCCLCCHDCCCCLLQGYEGQEGAKIYMGPYIGQAGQHWVFEHEHYAEPPACSSLDGRCSTPHTPPVRYHVSLHPIL